jgi:acetyl-CoA carboxylase biotin carboxylase subunit
MGIETVCVYVNALRAARARRRDRRQGILRRTCLGIADRGRSASGPGPAKQSYIDISRIIAAAEIADVDAIHPGYGFLSERADFSQACRDCKIEFIGPTPEAMGKLGDKVACKQTAKANEGADLPRLRGRDRR